jgi:hypothetical protein
VPRNLTYYDLNNSCDGRSTPKAKVKWEHPENLNTGFKLSHYVYIYNGTKPIKRFVNESFTLDRSLYKAYDFEVYAVDMCGQEGEHAGPISIPESNRNR